MRLHGHVAGVVRRLDVLHEEDGDAARDRGEPHGLRRVPPRGDLDRLERGERRHQVGVVGERARRHLEREPVGRVAEREQLGVVPARGEPVEVLEDVAVAAADAGVLGDVDDAQPPLRRAHGALVEERAPALPEVPLRGQLARPGLRRPGLRLEVDAAWRAGCSRCGSPPPTPRRQKSMSSKAMPYAASSGPTASSAARLMYRQAPVVPSTGVTMFASGCAASLKR